MALTKEVLNARMAARNPKLAATVNPPAVEWDIPEHRAELGEFEKRMVRANKFGGMTAEAMAELVAAVEGI